MKISTLADRDLVAVDLKAPNRDDAIREIVEALTSRRKIAYKRPVLTDILNRECCNTTAIGNGVAIPHARAEHLEKPLMFVAVSRSGVDFEAPDGKPVHLIFLLLTPMPATGTHLKTLSRIASLAQDTDAVRRLIDSASDDDLFRQLKDEQIDRDGFLQLTENAICQEINTRPGGLSDEDAAERLSEYGGNELKQVRKTSLLVRFVDNLTNLLAVLMWFGSVLAFLVGMFEVGWAIIGVIFINAFFSFWQEFKAEKALEALRKLIPNFVTVLRSGEAKRVPALEIVPGDVMLFEEGDNITADARLIEAHELKVDNSIFSGESRAGYKTAEPLTDRRDFLWTEVPNLVFAGTSVVSGMGRAVVIATGMSTELGKIAYLTQKIKPELSPLQKEINRLTKMIAMIAVVTGIVFFIIGSALGELSPVAAAIFAIGIIIANVPEGLLPTVTLALAMGVQRMAKRHALIKKLSSVETLGSTNVICTDKTGTLTTNQMSVQKIWLNHKLFEVTGTTYEPRGEFIYSGARGGAELLKDGDGAAIFMRACILCSTARLVPPSFSQGPAAWSIIGDPTEGALLVLAEKAGYDIEQERNSRPLLKRYPFESVRKRMSAAYPRRNGRARVYVKGAPREVIELCRGIFIDGKEQELTDEERLEITGRMDEFAGSGLRVLGIAFRDTAAEEVNASQGPADLEKDLVFLGLAAMYDPPRPGVKEALSLCRKAGIRVVMITGDYGVTALAIAREVGIVTTETARVVTGADLSRLSEEELREVLKGEVVFARVNPEHKLRVVNAFREMGQIVAVTGDGVNDAPALKRADIGIAMGIRGTDVAKESAEMVLTDDNFASIVSAIEEGRAVFSNIKKFITYIFAHLVPEAVPFILFVLFKVPAPITVMQILAIDLGTETLPALALGVENPEPGIMDQPPRPRRQGLVDRTVLFRGYVYLGILNSIAVMGAYFLILYQGGWHFGMQLESDAAGLLHPLHLKATTMVFAGIVVMQIANVFACRSETKSAFRIGLFGNRLLIWGIIFEIIITAALIYIPAFQGVFSTIAITAADWAILLGFMLVIFFLEELRKVWVRRRLPPQE
ncbi:MAG: HAD-IC family P-type ATPase [Syntrophaceae bacterium]